MIDLPIDPAINRVTCEHRTPQVHVRTRPSRIKDAILATTEVRAVQRTLDTYLP